jgi:hypothetical protein
MSAHLPEHSHVVSPTLPDMIEQDDFAQQRAILSRLAGQPVTLTEFGPKSHHAAIGRLEGYPTVGMTTLVTFGASPHARSMWRGSPLHYELVLTLEDGNGLEPGMAECLRAVVHEEQRRAREKDRRPVIETNGVWAPGYAPHLVFAATSAAPNLMTRKKCGSRYVFFLAAVAIDDRELRMYDRSPGDFVAGLNPKTIARYPRTEG